MEKKTTKQTKRKTDVLKQTNQISQSTNQIIPNSIRQLTGGVGGRAVGGWEVGGGEKQKIYKKNQNQNKGALSHKIKQMGFQQS